MKNRKFENDMTRSKVMILDSLDVNRASHATHLRIMEDSSWKDYIYSIDGIFTDQSFPPEKSSILGLGVDLENKPVDPTA